MKATEIKIGASVAVNVYYDIYYGFTKIRKGLVVSQLEIGLWAVRLQRPLEDDWYHRHIKASRTGHISEYEAPSRAIVSPWKEYREKAKEEKKIVKQEKEVRQVRQQVGIESMEHFNLLLETLGQQEDCHKAKLVIDNSRQQPKEGWNDLCNLEITPELMQLIVEALEGKSNSSALTQLLNPKN